MALIQSIGAGWLPAESADEQQSGRSDSNTVRSHGCVDLIRTLKSRIWDRKLTTRAVDGNIVSLSWVMFWSTDLWLGRSGRGAEWLKSHAKLPGQHETDVSRLPRKFTGFPCLSCWAIQDKPKEEKPPEKMSMGEEKVTPRQFTWPCNRVSLLSVKTEDSYMWKETSSFSTLLHISFAVDFDIFPNQPFHV